MNTPNEFDFQLQPPENAPDADEATVRTLEALGVFLARHVIKRRPGGELPPATSIAGRLIALEAILQPGGESLRSLARQLGCSGAYLSRLGLELADSVNLRSSWQRLRLRDEYSVRARGVAAGTWRSTDKWERDKLRIAKRKRAKATATTKAMQPTDSNPETK